MVSKAPPEMHIKTIAEMTLKAPEMTFFEHLRAVKLY